MRASGWAHLARLLVAGVVLAAVLVPTRSVVDVSVEDARISSFTASAPFTLSYVHSIDGLPIEEDLVVSEGEMWVERTRLKQFGAGMGYLPEHGAGHAEGDWWVVDGYDRSIGDTLTVRAGAPHIDHRLHYQDTQILLSACWPGERIRIHIRRISLIQQLFPLSLSPRAQHTDTTQCLQENP